MAHDLRTPLFDFSFAPDISGSFSTYALNTATKKVVFILPVDTVNALEGGFAWTGTAGTDEITVRMTLETIDSSGNPSGTLVAAGATKDVNVNNTGAAGSTWSGFDTNPAPGYTHVALVLQNVSAAPTVDYPTIRVAFGSAGHSWLPRARTFDGTSWANVGSGGAYPIAALREASGGRVCARHCFLLSVNASFGYANNTSIRECGNQWTMQGAGSAALLRAWMSNVSSASANGELALYQSGAEIAKAVIAGKDFSLSGGTLPVLSPITTGPQSILDAIVHRATLRPTTTNTMRIAIGTFKDAASVKAMMGMDCCRVEKDSGGSWTTFTDQLAWITPLMSEIGSGSGGGGGLESRFNGGMN